MSGAKPAARLLVVDDDAGLLRLAAKTLGREGYTVATAASGGEAVEWLRRNSADLALFDLKLPDLEAPQLISQLAELRRLPPFLIITGQGDERVAVEMMKSGARDYLVKGRDFLEFLPGVVERVLKQLGQEQKLAAAEAALRQSESRFRIALKHSPIIVFNQDAELRYTWVHNQPTELPEQAFLGKTDGEIFGNEDAERLTQLKMRCLVSGAGARQELPCTIGGQRRVYDVTVEPVTDADGQITGVTGAAMDITERKRLEEEVLHISELEQRRIGQDLHDGICQHLAGIELKCQALEDKLSAKAKAFAPQVGALGGHVREVIAQTRSLARGLSPFILEAEGLASALRELAANSEKLFGIKCSFTGDAGGLNLSANVATHLYRIAQEAITNGVKHGKASAIEISLSAKGGNLLLMIDDNGRGFQQHPATATGMGLRTMHYRAGIIGATLLTQQQNHGGARIVCFLPQPTSIPA